MSYKSKKEGGDYNGKPEADELRRKMAGLSRPYRPPREKPGWDSNTASLAGDEQQGRVVLPKNLPGAERRKEEGLSGKLASFITISGILAGIFFLSFSFSSPNVSLSPGVTGFNWKLWLGVFLILVGLVAGFFWMKGRKKVVVSKKGKKR